MGEEARRTVRSIYRSRMTRGAHSGKYVAFSSPDVHGIPMTTRSKSSWCDLLMRYDGADESRLFAAACAPSRLVTQLTLPQGVARLRTCDRECGGVRRRGRPGTVKSLFETSLVRTIVCVPRDLPAKTEFPAGDSLDPERGRCKVLLLVFFFFLLNVGRFPV